MNKKIIIGILILLITVMIASCESDRAGDETKFVEDTEKGVIEPADPNTAGLSQYQDEDLDEVPSTPLSTKFVVEHRSALDEKEITIKGVVVATLLGERACPPDRGMCAQPRIFLADTIDDDRNKNYDVMVLLDADSKEDEKDYPIGDLTIVKAKVSSSKSSVNLRRVY